MWRVQLSAAATQSLRTLSPENQRVVLEAIGRLTLGPNPPGSPQPYRLSNRPDLIVLQAGSRYHVAYSLDHGDNTITVVDVVARETRPADRAAAMAS